MRVRAYVEWLSAFGADRAATLHNEGTLEALYVKLYPADDAAQENKGGWPAFVRRGVPLWGWAVCSADQAADVSEIQALDSIYRPDGWVLNIEKVLEGADLSVLCAGVKALGKPVVASLAGANPNHHLYDHRALDRAGFVQEWQSYDDSEEGPPPALAVWELYKPRRVLVGAEYRAQIGLGWGWGAVTRADELRAEYRYFPQNRSFTFGVSRRLGWPPLYVTDRYLVAIAKAGQLLGLAPYSRIRVAIISDQIALDKTGTLRDVAGWEAWAASAKMPGLVRRGVSVYLGERASDEMLRAVAKGAE